MCLWQSSRRTVRKQGDRKTPVGSFKIVAKYPHASWAYFCGLIIPIPHRGSVLMNVRKKGFFNEKMNLEVLLEYTVCPKVETIMLLSVQTTLGCVSISRKNIMLLYNAIPIGTEVQIFE